jgi:Holliday junction resolvasome RuvABC endonuclease subunit
VSTRPLALGLDPDSKGVGWAIVDLWSGSPRLCGTVIFDTMTKDDDLALASAYWEAFREITVQVGPHGRITHVGVEQGYVGKNRRTTIKVSEAIGICIQTVVAWHDPQQVFRFQPKEWRQLCGLKGNSSKEEVVAQAKKMFWQPPDSHAADAGLIAQATWLKHRMELYEHGERR